VPPGDYAQVYLGNSAGTLELLEDKPTQLYFDILNLFNDLLPVDVLGDVDKISPAESAWASEVQTFEQCVASASLAKKAVCADEFELDAGATFELLRDSIALNYAISKFTLLSVILTTKAIADFTSGSVSEDSQWAHQARIMHWAALSQSTSSNAPLSPPRSLFVQRVGDGQVLLHWVAPPGFNIAALQGYEVDAKNPGEQWHSVTTGISVSANLTQAAESCGAAQSCSFRVVAVATNGTRAASGPVIVRNNLPGAPVDVTAERLADGVLVSWSPPEVTGGLPVSGYEVEEDDNGAGWGQLNEYPPSPNEVMASCSQGDNCQFKVSAGTDAGYGPFSTVAQAANNLPGAAIVSHLGLVGPGQVLLAWQAPTSTGGLPLSGYEIETSDDGGTWGQAIQYPANPDIRVLLLSCPEGSRCSFKVAALSEAGDGPFSSPVSIFAPVVAPSTLTTGPGGQPPSAPSGLTARRVPSGVLLAWTAPSAAYGLPLEYYEVLISTNRGRDWRFAVQDPYNDSPDVPTEPPTLVDKNCPDDQTCWYKVEAVTSAGTSAASPVAKVANNPPSAPSEVNAERVPSGVLLAWTAPSAAYGLPLEYYEVLISTNRGRDWRFAVQDPYNDSPDVPTEPPTLVDKNCPDDQTCWYKVEAVTSAGTSAASVVAGVPAWISP
jgi:hypothetical protein